MENNTLPPGMIAAQIVDFSAEVELEPVDMPEDDRGLYRFFRNAKTGNLWKVKSLLRNERPDGRADLAPTVRVLIVQVSACGDDSKALRDDDDLALVSEPFTHTIEDRTLQEEGAGFDWRANALHAVLRAIAAMEKRLAAEAGRSELDALLGLKPEIPTPTEEENE